MTSTCYTPSNRESSRKLELPVFALRLISMLEEASYETWCVGGFVRDALLGRPANDIDLATSALWTDVKRVCEHEGLKTNETGIKHGTITVYDPEEKTSVAEITTFRADGASSDHRHPKEVRFVRTIEEDLARRDFTVNALAYHPERGICDPFGGINDMGAGILRAIGNPAKRFEEDALRILRAARFFSQLGFSIEPDTYQAALSSKHLLSSIAKERIRHELDLLLKGNFVHDALVGTIDVISFVLPELIAMKGCEQRTKYHIYDVLEHTAYAVQNMPVDRLGRWAALFHDSGKPAAAFLDQDGVGHFYGHAHCSVMLAESALTRLGFSRSFISDVLALVKRHDEPIQPTRKAVKKALLKLDGNIDLFMTLCDLKRADALAQAPMCRPRAEQAEELKRIAADIADSNDALRVTDLAINGNDLMDMGMEKGPELGRMLNDLLADVIAGNLENDREALLKSVSKRLERRRA